MLHNTPTKKIKKNIKKHLNFNIFFFPFFNYLIIFFFINIQRDNIIPLYQFTTPTRKNTPSNNSWENQNDYLWNDGIGATFWQPVIRTISQKHMIYKYLFGALWLLTFENTFIYNIYIKTGIFVRKINTIFFL